MDEATNRAKKMIRRELGLGDEEIERLLFLWKDFSRKSDVTLDLLELFTRYWLVENGPKSKAIINVKELFLFILSQAKYCNSTGRPLLIGKWKPNKIITLSLYDYTKLGFMPPPCDIIPWRFGKIVKDLEKITSELHEDHWIDVKETPKSYLLLKRGDEQVSEVIDQIDWWEDELTLLTRVIRYWIIATEKAPKLTKEYSKLIGQRQFGARPDQEAEEIREKIDGIVLPKLEKIKAEETLPMEAAKVTETGVIDLHLNVERQLVTTTVFDCFYPVGTLPRESVQSSDDVFLENGESTNYRFPPANGVDPVDVCNYVLTIARKCKAKTLIVDRDDFKLIRTFNWRSCGIQTFLYDVNQRVVPVDGKATVPRRGKVLLFVRTLSKAEGIITVLEKLNLDVTVVGLFHKSYDKRDKLRESCDINVKREPIDLGISWRGDIPEPPLTAKDLLPRVKPERIPIARLVVPAIEFSDYGAFISTSGLPSGVWICQNRLFGERPASYQTILQFATERIAKSRPDFILVHRNMEFGGVIAMKMNLPLARLTAFKSADLQIEYKSAIISKENLVNVFGGKRILFVSLFDSFITKDIIKALFRLRQTGANISIFVVFDRWELGATIRNHFEVDYALSWAELWLALPDDKRLLIEKDLVSRKEIVARAFKEVSPTSLLPSSHHYSRLAITDMKANRNQELAHYC